jgi:hypothetical protein
LQYRVKSSFEPVAVLQAPLDSSTFFLVSDVSKAFTSNLSCSVYDLSGELLEQISTSIDLSTYGDCSFQYPGCGSGTVTLTTNEVLAYTAGMRVRLSETSNPYASLHISGYEERILIFIINTLPAQLDYKLILSHGFDFGIL